MLLTNPTTRTKTLLALATGIALILSGCTVKAKQVTNVTVSSATLNAEVSCGSGSVSWQLREAGQAQWRTVAVKPAATCPKGVGGAPPPKTAQVSEPVAGLRASAVYEFRVGIDPPGEIGVVYSQASRFTTGGGGTRPVVVPASGGAPATLRMGSPAGPRMQLRGVNVWGLQDSITTSFGASQYANRAAIASTIKSWGGNVVRFRVLADDYNKAPSAATGGLTKAQIIQRIKDWRDAVVSRGMYFMPCSWDALDGAYSDAAWAGNGSRVHQMFADIRKALGDDPMVVYEVTNEPNNVSWDAWNANMQGSIKFFRETLGYRGLLVIDPIWWANSGTGGQGYDDARYSGARGLRRGPAGDVVAPARLRQARLRERLRGQGLERRRVGRRAGRRPDQAPDLRDRVRQLQRRPLDGERRVGGRRGQLLPRALRLPAELRGSGRLPVRPLVRRQRDDRREQLEHHRLGRVGARPAAGRLSRRGLGRERLGAVGRSVLAPRQRQGGQREQRRSRR